MVLDSPYQKKKKKSIRIPHLNILVTFTQKWLWTDVLSERGKRAHSSLYSFNNKEMQDRREL